MGQGEGGAWTVRARLWLVAEHPGMSVPQKAPLEEAELCGGHDGSAQWVSLGCGVKGWMGPLNILATACHSTCHPTTKRGGVQSRGTQNLQMPHEGQEHLSHSVSQRVVLGTPHQGHRGGLVKSVDSAFKQTSQVALLLGVGVGNLVTTKLRPWQKIEPEVRRASWMPGGTEFTWHCLGRAACLLRAYRS